MCVLNRSLKDVELNVIVFYLGFIGVLITGAYTVVEGVARGFAFGGYDRQSWLLITSAVLVDCVTVYASTIAY